MVSFYLRTNCKKYSYSNKQKSTFLTVSHSLVFFLLHLLPLSVFFFFINDVENSVLKQLETGSSSSGNKSLSFRTVSLQHRGGYRPGTTTKKKKKKKDERDLKKMVIYHTTDICICMHRRAHIIIFF